MNVHTLFFFSASLTQVDRCLAIILGDLFAQVFIEL